MVKARWVIVAVATGMIFAGCQHSRFDFSCKPPTLDTQMPKSDHLRINIYLDGTPSMEGYANNDTKSRFSQTLDLLDSTFLLSSAKVGLGTGLQPINREQFLKDTQLPSFYNGDNPQYPKFQETEIDKAIALGKDNQLSVIITDLYQEDSDITKVSQEIQKNYLNSEQVKKGYAVGILGVRSEFNGIIYNEDIQNSHFHYNTKDKPLEKYHPFYALFLGKYSDIDYFFTKLFKQSGSLVNQNNSVIFSPNYASKKESLATSN